MNKYQIGQTLYWFKYVGHQPDLMSFEVASIKQTQYGYKYSPGQGNYICEVDCFLTIHEAVEYVCKLLRGFLNE